MAGIGLFIEPVWQQADGRVRVFDYGCGQGLGSALLLEHGLLAAW